MKISIRFKAATVKWIIAFFFSLSLTGCLEDVISTGGGNTHGESQIYVQPNYPIWCQERQADNPIVGCWVSPRCDYSPMDFYYTKDDPTDNTTEDYWFKSVVSYVADPGYKVLANGELVNLDGRWMLGGLWYTNDTCTGDAAFVTNGFIVAFYRLYDVMTTAEGLPGTVVQLFSGATSGTTEENLRYYDLMYTTEGTYGACWYQQDVNSPEVNIIADPGETVLTALDLNVCYSFAEPGTQNWMSDKLEWKERWGFTLYQGNNIWVSAWDNTIINQ